MNYKEENSMKNPFKSLKNWFINKKDLIEEIKYLNDNINVLQEKCGEANYVIENVLERGINWYNYKELDRVKQIEYYEDAQRILQTEVFQNEFMHYVADLVQFIAKNSPDHDTTIALRYSINGVEALKERLEAIVDPRKTQASTDNIHDAV